MKTISKRNLRFKYRLRSRSGISLVEVLMVLGISSMLIAGSFAWFDARKSSDFYDQVRQIESKIREVQSENTSSMVPGYDSALGSPCNQPDRSGCAIEGGEEVFGTAVSIMVPNTGDLSTKMRILYIKKGPKSTTAPLQASWVQDYERSEIELPLTIKLEGFTIFGDATCTSGAYNNWRNLPQTLSGPNYQDFAGAGSKSMVVFRRITGGYNAFWPSWGSGGSADIAKVLVNSSRPAWGSLASSSVPGWLGSYDDSSFIYQTTPSGSAATNRLQSQPCAVRWRFGSVERSAADNTKPRFTAEINFNLVDGTTTLVTQ